jgi:hypothetical protein
VLGVLLAALEEQETIQRRPPAQDELLNDTISLADLALREAV